MSAKYRFHHCLINRFLIEFIITVSIQWTNKSTESLTITTCFIIAASKTRKLPRKSVCLPRGNGDHREKSNPSESLKSSSFAFILFPPLCKFQNKSKNPLTNQT